MSEVIHQIQVSADGWRAFVMADAKAKAAEKEAKALRAELGLPETAELVSLLGATAELGAKAVIVDGNGTPVGSITVYWRPPVEMKGYWVGRVNT